MQTTMHRYVYDMNGTNQHESIATLVITAAALMMLAGLVLFFFRLFPATTPDSLQVPVNEINAELPSEGQAMDGTAL